MDNHESHHRPVSNRLHPGVYVAIVGLVLLLVLAAWGFAGGGYTDFLLAVVSGFLFFAIALPYRVWRKSQGADAVRESSGSFLDWTSGDFDTWQGRLTGADAIVQILLPFAAIALGMTAFAIVLHFIPHAGI